MATLPLTRDLLAVRQGAALDYASDAEEEQAPQAAAAATSASEPSRSAGTFRGALHGLGLPASGAKPTTRGRLELGAAGASAGGGLSTLGGSLAFTSDAVRLDAFSRHKRLMEDYQRFYGKPNAKPTTYRTDADVLRENYRFVRTAEDDAQGSSEQRQARAYYEALHKEYALADFSQYREGRVGLRWRTESEVLAGTGQFSCGALKCPRSDGLASFELNFSFLEAGQPKQALVKLRVCPDHAYQLHYRKLRDMEHAQKEAQRSVKREERQKRKDSKRERKERKHSSSSRKSKSSKKRSRRERDVRSSDSSSSASSSSDDEGSARKVARRGSAPAAAASSSAAGAAAESSSRASQPQQPQQT